jgi:hypothetical protein
MRVNTPPAVCSLLIVGVLTGCQTVTPLETRVSPQVITLSKISSKGIDPLNCNDWLSPSWMDPEPWWLSLPLSQLPRAGLHAVVGFDLLTDRQGNCRKFRQDLYRAGFRYDLSQRQNLKGLVTKAELTFFSAALPSGVRPNSLCQIVTGGGGSLIVLAPAASLPVANQRMAYLGSENTAVPFPAGARIFSIPQPFFGGQIATGVVGTPSLGLAGFSVDVTNLVTAALDRGATALSFMISGSDEAAPTVFVGTAQDCKTTYRIDELVIRHL